MTRRDELAAQYAQRFKDEAHAAFSADWPALEPELMALYRDARAQLEAQADEVAAARLALAAILQAAYKRGYLRGMIAASAPSLGQN